MLVRCKKTDPNPIIPAQDPVEQNSDSNKTEDASTDSSSTLDIEDDFPPDTSPGLIDPVDFARDILTKNPDLSETELRVLLYKAGYFPEEINVTAKLLFPSTESTQPEESSSSSENESSSESSSKTESSSESSKNEESEESTDDESEESTNVPSTPSSSESSKTESQSSSSSSQSQSSSQQQESSSKPPESSQTSQSASCDHEWVDVTTTVHHDAVTEQVWVVDQAAYDEEVVIEAAWDEEVETGEWQYVCASCGFATQSESELDNHLVATLEDPNHTGSYYSAPVTTTVHHEAVTETVHHDEEGHYETKVTQEAYDETVVTGQKCSKCGATK